MRSSIILFSQLALTDINIDMLGKIGTGTTAFKHKNINLSTDLNPEHKGVDKEWDNEHYNDHLQLSMSFQRREQKLPELKN